MADPIPLEKARRRRGNNKPPPANDTEEPTCPVTALGHVDGKFWFLNAIGEKRGISTRQISTRAELVTLFGGNPSWLMRRFPAHAEDGSAKGFSVVQAYEHLMRECFEAGIYGEHVIIRQPGVWPGERGKVIAHCGDALFVEGEKYPSGRKLSGQIFAAAPPETYPAVRPCDRTVAQRFCDDIRQLWNLKLDGGEIIAIGLVGQGYYAAALSWRSNGFISGASMGGKSHLLNLLRAMVPIHHYTNDTSKAGVEGAVGGRAMPIFIDEAVERDPLAAQILVNMVLSSSSGTGTKGYRGTADGGKRIIEVVGTAIMASINTLALEPQQRSRFAIIELEQPAAGIDHRPQMEAAIERAKDFAPALFARALAGFERFGLALQTFRAALGIAGCVAREMDQLGSILAGHWVLTQDGVPDEDTAADMVKDIADFITGAEVMARDSSAQAVFSKLMSTLVALHRSTEQDSIAALVRRVLAPAPTPGDLEQQRSALKVLRKWGIRPIRKDQINEENSRKRSIPRLGDGNGLWIDDRVDGLRKIFVGSSYDAGRWIMELQRLPKARRTKDNVRVSDLNSGPALWISLDDVGEFGFDDDD